MEKEEIQKIIDGISFPEAKEGEVKVNVPLYIPQVLFMDSVEEFAESQGWIKEIEDPEDNTLKIDNPISSVEYLAIGIRQELKRKFERFIQVKAIKQANESAKTEINQMFN